ncbi:MAG: sodium:solute symporter family protein [Myxococcales bacterium]|nr:sodium:solute symporter family protein [Myxococcales bacterium]
MSSVTLAAVGVIALLYAAVFVVGVRAGRSAPDGADGSLTELLLAGRALPVWIGLLTMTATWVGGGYINGTAENTYTSGVLWGAQAGLGYAVSLMVGGAFFAAEMRRRGYVTLVDPFQERYGPWVGLLMLAPAILAELFWSGAILVALGTTFGTVLGVDLTTSILISSAVAVLYTTVGGLRAVASTDVLQLLLIVAGLGIAVPYVVSAAGGLSPLLSLATSARLSSTGEALSYADWSILLILGGIPWNVYFQRVLACPTPEAARATSMAAGVLCALMAVPPLLLGLAATQLDWTALAGDQAAALADTPALVLPYVLRYAVPDWVAILGLGAVSAAVMSSVDSSILSAASLATWNGYARVIRPDAPDEETRRVLRAAIVLLGGVATVVALSVQSVGALWYLCGDVVYCVLFPQLTLALFSARTTRLGALAGFGVSVGVRLLAGDGTLGIPAFVDFPQIDGHEFPFRTLAMMAGFATTWCVSWIPTGR